MGITLEQNWSHQWPVGSWIPHAEPRTYSLAQQRRGPNKKENHTVDHSIYVFYVFTPATECLRWPQLQWHVCGPRDLWYGNRNQTNNGSVTFTFPTRTHTHTVRQNVCSRGSHRLVILLAIGRCTQTCLKMTNWVRSPLWVNHREFKNWNSIMAGTSDWSGQISPALIQCLRCCKTGWAASPALIEKLNKLKIVSPLETGVDPTHEGLSLGLTGRTWGFTN